ncbi:uncharacterized protein BcabD6B2_28610 [Babesia caballi]|uniref:Uncharacterized protein n=1 Tax=Babesia caballi TaxID=5871 RepID=A0AAV4LUB6_BABCB|nr:hypothetical protein BcabD6B2_28610 [Babesia caballi]
MFLYLESLVSGRFGSIHLLSSGHREAGALERRQQAVEDVAAGSAERQVVEGKVQPVELQPPEEQTGELQLLSGEPHVGKVHDFYRQLRVEAPEKPGPHLPVVGQLVEHQVGGVGPATEGQNVLRYDRPGVLAQVLDVAHAGEGPVNQLEPPASGTVGVRANQQRPLARPRDAGAGRDAPGSARRSPLQLKPAQVVHEGDLAGGEEEHLGRPLLAPPRPRRAHVARNQVGRPVLEKHVVFPQPQTPRVERPSPRDLVHRVAVHEGLQPLLGERQLLVRRHHLHPVEGEGLEVAHNRVGRARAAHVHREPVAGRHALVQLLQRPHDALVDGAAAQTQVPQRPAEKELRQQLSRLRAERVAVQVEPLHPRLVHERHEGLPALVQRQHVPREVDGLELEVPDGGEAAQLRVAQLAVGRVQGAHRLPHVAVHDPALQHRVELEPRQVHLAAVRVEDEVERRPPAQHLLLGRRQLQEDARLLALRRRRSAHLVIGPAEPQQRAPVDAGLERRAGEGPVQVHHEVRLALDDLRRARRRLPNLVHVQRVADELAVDGAPLPREEPRVVFVRDGHDAVYAHDVAVRVAGPGPRNGVLVHWDENALLHALVARDRDARVGVHAGVVAALPRRLHVVWRAARRAALRVQQRDRVQHPVQRLQHHVLPGRVHRAARLAAARPPLQVEPLLVQPQADEVLQRFQDRPRAVALLAQAQVLGHEDFQRHVAVVVRVVRLGREGPFRRPEPVRLLQRLRLDVVRPRGAGHVAVRRLFRGVVARRRRLAELRRLGAAHPRHPEPARAHPHLLLRRVAVHDRARQRDAPVPVELPVGLVAPQSHQVAEHRHCVDPPIVPRAESRRHVAQQRRVQLLQHRHVCLSSLHQLLHVELGVLVEVVPFASQRRLPVRQQVVQLSIRVRRRPRLLCFERDEPQRHRRRGGRLRLAPVGCSRRIPLVAPGSRDIVKRRGRPRRIARAQRRQALHLRRMAQP